MTRVLLAILLMGASTGCMPRTVVRQNPGPHDKGVRYYRPKPYLLIQPTLNKEDRYVTISMEYLPDFSEEYSINVRTGLGINNTTIKLENGWNLTEINQQLDSNVDDNIKAVSELIKSASSFTPTAGKTATMVVEATNVPLGYYESVISRGPDGRKRLYGWRYVGFAPFAPCPIESSGIQCHDCQIDQVYGLVFRKGVMVFELLSDIGQREARHVRMVPDQGATRLPPPVNESLADLVPEAAKIINDVGMVTVAAAQVQVVVNDDRESVDVIVTVPMDVQKKLKKIDEVTRGKIDEQLTTLVKTKLPDARAAQLVIRSEDPQG